MLALTRRAGEEVVIGDPANPLGIIRIVELHGDKVRLSFDFPREIQINRKELADQKLKSLKPDISDTASQGRTQGQSRKTPKSGRAQDKS